MFSQKISSIMHSLLILLGIILAYSWQTIDVLTPYSLQAFAFAVLTYFVIKRLNKNKIWHIAPQAMTVEMALVSFSFLMIIGATGNFDSIFYPLTYIHLFFLVFSTTPATAITAGFGLVMFHYALEPNIASGQLADLITLPLILIFFLFTKHQYNEILTKELNLEKIDNNILEHIENTILPKINHLKQLLPNLDKSNLTQELTQDIEEINEEVIAIETSLDGLMNQEK